MGELGLYLLDAPCTGSKNGQSGNLTFMVGGDEAVFERVRSFFEPMGRCSITAAAPAWRLAPTFAEPYHRQPAACVQRILRTGHQAGVPAALLLEILNNSAARSGLVAAKAPLVFARNFETHFSVKWLEEGYIADAGIRGPATCRFR